VALKKTHNSAIFQLSKQKPRGLTEGKICVNLRYPCHLRSILIFYAFDFGNKDKISCVCHDLSKKFAVHIQTFYTFATLNVSLLIF
jgi:hypothetical protein